MTIGMVAASGALVGVAVVLLAVGAVDGSGFVYASIVVNLLAAALLPLGAARRAQRHRRTAPPDPVGHLE
jgi:hypothetical protein